jgi:hypothetical protein
VGHFFRELVSDYESASRFGQTQFGMSQHRKKEPKEKRIDKERQQQI